jgi:preprotein translocase SecE subunit
MQIKKFIKEVLAEMEHVKWPSRKMIIGSTIAVFFISALTAAYLGGADVLLQKLLAKVVSK